MSDDLPVEFEDAKESLSLQMGISRVIYYMLGNPELTRIMLEGVFQKPYARVVQKPVIERMGSDQLSTNVLIQVGKHSFRISVEPVKIQEQ